MAEGDNLPNGAHTGANQQPGVLHESDLGNRFMGLPGVLIIAAYLVVLTVGILYVTIKVWPPGPATPAATSTPQATTTAGTMEQKWDVAFLWCNAGKPDGFCSITLNTSFFLISILLGALGSLLHALRSLYWYVGNRKMVWSWSVMYLLLPFCGAILSAIFYIVIRGGFLPQSNMESATPYGFAAMGALVGLFSEQAMLKLKQVAETFFARTQPGKDTMLPPLQVNSITPNSGPSAGGTPVTITGTNFADGAKVTIGGTPAMHVNVSSATSITAVSPMHAAGAADVQVTNTDNHADTLKGAFTFN